MDRFCRNAKDETTVIQTKSIIQKPTKHQTTVSLQKSSTADNQVTFALKKVKKRKGY